MSQDLKPRKAWVGFLKPKLALGQFSSEYIYWALTLCQVLARCWEDGGRWSRRDKHAWIMQSSGIRAVTKVCTEGKKNSGERAVLPREDGSHRQTGTSGTSLERKHWENKRNWRINGQIFKNFFVIVLSSDLCHHYECLRYMTTWCWVWFKILHKPVIYSNTYGNNLKIFLLKFSAICFYEFAISGCKCEIWFGLLRVRSNYITVPRENNFGG